MLKKLRVVLSILFFSLITFFFVDFAGLMPNGFHWLAHIQLIPAIMAVNVVIILVLVALTLLFGRIYCSSICPMGVFQDISSWLSKRFAKRKKRYKFSKAKTILRWAVLVASVAFTMLISFTDPYSAYGRMATNLFRPVYQAGNNILESIFTSFDNYTFYKSEIFISSIFAFVVSLLTFLIIGFLAWRCGRTYCNTICPVGTALGFLSKYSLYKVRIDADKCNSCGLCERKCKASCINSKERAVDYSRCVDCFNCLQGCKQNAIRFTPRLQAKAKKVTDEPDVNANRRQFLLASVTTAASVPALLAQEKAGLLNGGKSYVRQTPIAPPGARSIKHLLQKCTSCHLCISKCPTQILKPAFMEYGLGGIMMPTMYFEKGFCNFDCTICSDVCPNHALEMLTVEEKHLTQMGRVVFNEDICVVHTDGTNCGACAEHCPTQAVTMVPYEEGEGLTIPHINPDICVGCGGCEFICPVRPHTAIYVEGNAVHKQAEPFKEEEKVDIEIDSFGF